MDRADILSGARFDFKVEFAGLANPSTISITLNGKDYAQVFGKAARVCRTRGRKGCVRILPARRFARGRWRLQHARVTDGARDRELRWNVFEYRAAQGEERHLVHRRRDVARAPCRGALARWALRRGRRSASSPSTTCRTWPWSQQPVAIRSSPTRRIPPAPMPPATNSAVNAMGALPIVRPDPLDDPRVETVTSLARRRQAMAIGIVTNTEIENTPAAMVAHTRRRTEYDRIVEQYFAAKPDVLMGGGKADFLPKSENGSRRRDESDFLAQFRAAGSSLALTGPEMVSAAKSRVPPSCSDCLRSATSMVRSTANSSRAGPSASSLSSRI